MDDPPESGTTGRRQCSLTASRWAVFLLLASLLNLRNGQRVLVTGVVGVGARGPLAAPAADAGATPRDVVVVGHRNGTVGRGTADGLAVRASNGKEVRLVWHLSRRNEEDVPLSAGGIEACLEAGAICEVDVTRCADGFVLLHGPHLQGMTNGRGPISALNKTQIAKLRMKNGKNVTAQAPLSLEWAVTTLNQTRSMGHDGRIMLDLKIPAAEVTEEIAEEFAAILGGGAPEGWLLSSGERAGLEALARAVPALPRAYDPKEFVRAHATGRAARNASRWEAVARHVEEVDAAWRGAAPGSPAAQVFVDLRSASAARRVGVDLIGRWRGKGHLVGIWTLDASRRDVARVMGEYLRHEAPPTHIITNSPFGLQRLWADAEQAATT